MVALDLLQAKHRFAIGTLAIDMSLAVAAFALLKTKPAHKAITHTQKRSVFCLPLIDTPRHGAEDNVGGEGGQQDVDGKQDPTGVKKFRHRQDHGRNQIDKKQKTAQLIDAVAPTEKADQFISKTHGFPLFHSCYYSIRSFYERNNRNSYRFSE